MDERTHRYYQTHADEVGARYASIPSPLRRYFARTFGPGARVLDVGAGVGRDLDALAREGYAAYGVEPAEGLRAAALARFPDLVGRLHAGSLPDAMPSVADLGGPFDGVVCSAVLPHVERSKMFDAVFALKGLLVDRGRLLVSVPAERPDVVDARDAHGRLFNGVTADELELLLERAGFTSIGRWTDDDGLGRAGVRWTVLAVELRSVGEARPIDRIEAVLSTREKKVSTYKLALVRALCAIALTEPRRATFTADGWVRVPLDAIAERWIDYYWPLFASPTFLPQMNGEWDARRHRLLFADDLHALVDAYGRRGGLTGFVVDRRSGAVAEPAAATHRRLLAKLRRAIVTGPVTYAKGGGSTPMFRPDVGHVRVHASLWRELSLLGHWIQDALVLRWADLVSRLASGDVPAEAVVASLVTAASPEREASSARDLYRRQPGLACVWSGRVLAPATLAVDHVLPYALWRNNDLWNLLPAHRQVNGDKSDRLPTRGLLRARRDPIVHCWSLARDAYPTRFVHEARAQTGRPDADLSALFDALLESVETTALQRACPRWEP